jgi:hypothetical protein
MVPGGCEFEPEANCENHLIAANHAVKRFESPHKQRRSAKIAKLIAQETDATKIAHMPASNFHVITYSVFAVYTAHARDAVKGLAPSTLLANSCVGGCPAPWTISL